MTKKLVRSFLCRPKGLLHPKPSAEKQIPRFARNDKKKVAKVSVSIRIKLVTFERPDGLTSILRKKSLTAAMLVLLIAGLAPACVAGWNGEAASSCTGERQPAIRKNRNDGCRRAKDCGAQLRAQASHCGFRTFLQLQFAELRLAANELPKLGVRGTVPVQPAVTISLSSIGSPQSDRGPPLLHES
jgi:hypothetical protein